MKQGITVLCSYKGCNNVAVRTIRIKDTEIDLCKEHNQLCINHKIRRQSK